MEIILKKDIPKLGLANEIVTVKPGYGRNYLIPYGYGILASASAKKQHAEVMRQRMHKEEKLKQDAIALAENLEKLSLTVGAKASASGKIFGSVNTIQIAEAIAKEGYEVDRRKIALKENAIKELGNYTAKVVLYKGISVNVPFEVVAE
ncbi:MAG: 50S ribosomal protein L9 [Bacteroidales bacterium]